MNPEQIFLGLLGPQRMADPYPLYAALHEHGEVMAAGQGIVLVPSYEAANAVLRDPEYQVDDADYFDQALPGWRDHPALSTDSLLFLNAANHSRVRTLMTRQFTHRRVQALEPAIAALTDSLLDEMAGQGEGGEPVDFMQEFAFALPVAVIAELVGVQDWDREELKVLARKLTAVLEPMASEDDLAAADVAAVDMAGMFTALTADRRAAPRDDLASALASVAERDAGRLSETELVENLMLLLIAGFETTTNLLGNGMRILLDDQVTADGLRSGAVSAADFVEEVLRYDAPVQQTGRRRHNPGVLSGVDIPAGDQVVVMLAAANRDPRRFADPDFFRPGRPDAGPLSFGAGAHFCLGAALARLEGTVAFGKLLARFPGIAAAGDPERRKGLTFRGFEYLPVKLG
ncbi:MAG TPA: cytochrome P450 [Streptosporangiaceae bacterium]|nr:cytochrome P450 [Streptosporangiaceae bacterium]